MRKKRTSLGQAGKSKYACKAWYRASSLTAMHERRRDRRPAPNRPGPPPQINVAGDVKQKKARRFMPAGFRWQIVYDARLRRPNRVLARLFVGMFAFTKAFQDRR